MSTVWSGLACTTQCACTGQTRSLVAGYCIACMQFAAGTTYVPCCTRVTGSSNVLCHATMSIWLSYQKCALAGLPEGPL